MKHFIAIESATPSRGRYSFKVYQIKKNQPEYVGSGDFTYASTRGAESEVMSVIARLGLIPKKYEHGYYIENSWSPRGNLPTSKQTFKITYFIPANQK